MWRALVFLALLAVAAYAAVWIADNPGTVSIVWHGYDVTTSLAVALTVILVAAVVLGLIFSIVKGIIGLPSFIGRSSRERRRAKGMASLSRGMIAVGSGDPLAARRHAGDASRLLGDQPLTLLLAAQAAQISGDREAAERAFRDMTGNDETRVLGLRGLYVEAQRRDDEAAARAYAAEAARIAPSVTWANDAVLAAHCAEGNWSAATETVERRASLGLIDRPQSRRQRAVLLTAAAQSREAGEPEFATEQALKAVKLAPELVPAACLAARLLARRGDLRKAAKIVETAWKANPHPDLAQVYLGLRIGDSALDRLARAETLAKLSAWDRESRLAVAQTAYEAREFGRAREVCAPLVEDRPTARVCLLMARIEESEHGTSTGKAREWLARATRAPRDPAWVADGVVSDRWAPVSPVSGQLDAFVWTTPREILTGPDETRAVVEPSALEEPHEVSASAPVLAPSGAAPEPKPVTIDQPAAKPSASSPTAPESLPAAVAVSAPTQQTETKKPVADKAEAPRAEPARAPGAPFLAGGPPSESGASNDDQELGYPFKLRSRVLNPR